MQAGEKALAVPLDKRVALAQVTGHLRPENSLLFSVILGLK